MYLGHHDLSKTVPLLIIYELTGRTQSPCCYASFTQSHLEVFGLNRSTAIPFLIMFAVLFHLFPSFRI